MTASPGISPDKTVAISFVTYGELTKWTLVRHWGSQSLDTMRTFLAALVVLPYDQARRAKDEVTRRRGHQAR